MSRWKVECETCMKEYEANHPSMLNNKVGTCDCCGGDICGNCEKDFHERCDEDLMMSEEDQ